jgi:hypothetical protein
MTVYEEMPTNNETDLITHNETTEISSQSREPCTIGLMPTFFSVSRERPAPIRNRVMVNPILAKCTTDPYKGLKLGATVTTIEAATKAKIK